MSHLHERKEKTCLNCGADLNGRYCHDCGQENLEPKESIWHLIVHFFNDVTHFDGKFFSTIKFLLFKPGFLTEEYVKGKRASYLNPIRMYLFISAFFFLVFMSFFVNHDGPGHEDKKKDRAGNVRALTHSISVLTDSLDEALEETVDTLKYDTVSTNTVNVVNNDTLPPTVAEYDSIQRTLPKHKKDGVVKRYFKRKMIATQEYAQKNPDAVLSRAKANFYHSMPYMLFLSLPLVAFLLQLFYLRRRKQFYYVAHAIFTLHYYSFLFLCMLAIDTLEAFGKWGTLLTIPIYIWHVVYLYLAMRRFYKQGRFKTFIKFFLFYLIAVFMVSILTLVFFVNAFLNSAS